MSTFKKIFNFLLVAGAVALVPARADLRHDDEIVRIGLQGLANQPVGDMRAIEIAGVDMVHPRRDRVA